MRPSGLGFRGEEPFSVGQIGDGATPEPTLESAREGDHPTLSGRRHRYVCSEVSVIGVHPSGACSVHRDSYAVLTARHCYLARR
jgi:hypothetical protein